MVERQGELLNPSPKPSVFLLNLHFAGTTFDSDGIYGLHPQV